MPRFLLTLSLGPVQSLIADARRTRDLWCGSWLLSEASRAAARTLHDQHAGCLIFPCPDNPDHDLQPRDRPDDAANIANILRAEIALPDHAAVRALCDDAKRAAAARLAQLGKQALQKLDHRVREDVWSTQINDILEIFAAWVEIEDGAGYARASQSLGTTLGARKATRDFQPPQALPTEGLPKSSLDGARETVLPDWGSNHTARQKLRLSRGEQLDALGVVKRLAGDAEQFTALPRIAADPWVKRLTPAQRERLREVYEPLVGHGLATRIQGNDGAYRDLPFDGHLLYPSRLDREYDEAPDAAKPALDAFRQSIRQISREATDSAQRAGHPVPYAVLLKADGDRMGELLSRARNADESRAISRALHEFASGVRGIVRERSGHAIYAGGDDVLALLPLEHALACARALADAFKDSLTSVAERMDLPHANTPTLSVGLGIDYVIDPLGAMRALAERAEQHAKGDETDAPRNALAILLRIRSGGVLRWRTRWNDATAFDALQRFTNAYRDDELPARVAYDLRDIDRRFARLRDDSDAPVTDMRNAEVARLLDRARRDGGDKPLPAELRTLIQERAAEQPLAELADSLIIARWLSARTHADLGERS